MSNTVLEVKNLKKSYNDGDHSIEVLKGVDLSLTAGESVAIVGRSGAGKSTLLNLLGGLDKPSDGVVELMGVDLSQASQAQLNSIRNQQLGFVYQFHHLLPEFTALENVSMPLRIAGMKGSEIDRLATDMLDAVGLSERATHRPSSLSGGERQRVAIARALVNSPACVLMDEPTGNLDAATADEIQSLMATLGTEYGTAFIVVTHSKTLASSMGRALELTQGKLHEI